jgi:transposase
MNFQPEGIEIKNLDHLGIIAGIIDEIGIVEKVNELIGTDPREIINCGEVVKAIILNGLGFVSQPLYLFSNFFQSKAVEHFVITKGYSRDHRPDLKQCLLDLIVSSELGG